MFITARGLLGIGLLMLAATVRADVYQAPADFLAEVFQGQVPEPEVLWLRGEVKLRATAIMGHAYPALRIRYWRREATSAWILDEVGKEQPITTGIVVRDGRIARMRVLEYRESRGWEVRQAFFTDQFIDATLGGNDRLDRHIDNISGATLSVRALTRLARLALYLDSQRRD